MFYEVKFMDDVRPLRRWTKVLHRFPATGMATGAGGYRVLVLLDCGHRKSVKNSDLRRGRLRFRCGECRAQKERK